MTHWLVQGEWGHWKLKLVPHFEDRSVRLKKTYAVIVNCQELVGSCRSRAGTVDIDWVNSVMIIHGKGDYSCSPEGWEGLVNLPEHLSYCICLLMSALQDEHVSGAAPKIAVKPYTCDTTWSVRHKQLAKRWQKSVVSPCWGLVEWSKRISIWIKSWMTYLLIPTWKLSGQLNGICDPVIEISPMYECFLRSHYRTPGLPTK